MSDQKILKDSHSVTSSPESVDGREHYSSQDGVQTDLFGLEALPASHSLQPGKEKEKTTSDISGRSSLISSASASLQQSLVSKLQQLSDTDGSTIYKLTLREKVTPAQRSYYQLAASALRTKEKDSSSWLTPTTSDTNGVRKPDGKRGLGLNTQAQSAWPTPAARDGKGVSGSGRQEKKGNPSDTVPNAAATVPWPTPRAGDGGRNSRTPEGAERELVRKNMKPEDLNQAIRLAAVPWATPTATDHSRGTKPPRPQDTGIPLTQQVSGLTPWATPNTMDHMKQRSDEALARAKQKGGMLELERSDSLFWGSSEVIYCRDGKYRPIPTEPEIFPLADGISNRVGILRGAGNAIVPQAAAEIIKAYLYD
jgi:hypothetical protein